MDTLKEPLLGRVGATERRSKAYKWRYVLARRIAAGALALLLASLGLLAWTLKGNLALQRKALANMTVGE